VGSFAGERACAQEAVDDPRKIAWLDLAVTPLVVIIVVIIVVIAFAV
jgi:hypothetical protein